MANYCFAGSAVAKYIKCKLIAPYVRYYQTMKPRKVVAGATLKNAGDLEALDETLI